jgi:hypothetical protein
MKRAKKVTPAKKYVEPDYIKNIKDPIYWKLRHKKGGCDEGECMYIELVELEAHPIYGPQYRDGLDKILHKGKYSKTKKTNNKGE